MVARRLINQVKDPLAGGSLEENKMSNQDTPIDTVVDATLVDNVNTSLPLPSDELRRCDLRFAANLLDSSKEIETLKWAESRGLLPQTLQRWGMGLVPAQAFNLSKGDDHTVGSSDYLRAGLIVQRRRTPFEAPIELDHKHDIDTDNKDRRPSLPGYRSWLSGRVAWPLPDQTGQIKGFVGRWSDDSKTIRELAGDFESDEVWMGELVGKPAKYLGLTKHRSSRKPGGAQEIETYPLQLSPGFVARCSGIDFSPSEKPGKVSKYEKIKDKTTPIWVPEGYLDGVLASQAGVDTIACGGCETFAEQVDELVKLLKPFAAWGTPIYLCFDADPEGRAKNKDLELGAGQRGVCALLAKIWARDPRLARLIKVVRLPQPADGSKVDLADILRGLYAAFPKPIETEDIAANLTAWADFEEDVLAVQKAKLEELQAAAVESIEYLIAQIPPDVRPRDRSSALEECGLAAVAAYDPDLWLEVADRVAELLGLEKKERKAWIKGAAKEAAKEAEALRMSDDEDVLLHYKNPNGSIRAEHEAVRTLVERMSEQWDRRDHLWWNEMALIPVMMGEECTDSALAELRRKLARQHRCNVKHKSELREVIENISQLNRRHPVREYLKGLKPWDGVDRAPQMLEQVLGITPESEDQRRLYTTFIRKWMIGAVARVHATKEQTVKFDNVLVLGGAQDLCKSGVFDALVPVESWAGSPDISGFDDNSAIKLSPLWIAEMAESNGSSYWKDVERQKAWLSKRSDMIIRKYVAYAEMIPRRFALGATVNEKQHGADSTGFRREWCMWMTRPADIKLLLSLRDQLWAQAYAAYLAWVARGRHIEECPWWLDEDEKALHKVDGQQFQVADFEQDRVRLWLEKNGKEVVCGLDVALGIGIERPHSGDTRRITRHLAALGWEATQIKRPSPYRAPEGWRLSLVQGGGQPADPGGPTPDRVLELVGGILADET